MVTLRFEAKHCVDSVTVMSSLDDYRRAVKRDPRTARATVNIQRWTSWLGRWTSAQRTPLGVRCRPLPVKYKLDPDDNWDLFDDPLLFDPDVSALETI